MAFDFLKKLTGKKSELTNDEINPVNEQEDKELFSCINCSTLIAKLKMGKYCKSCAKAARAAVYQ